ncbi:MAG TPA: tetratricopeptide repeat protein, partial [Rhodocyclaceae bacterium]|nr:tetratricopeptide repeat protein [Rhodocyclaceae bacterium]
LIVLTATLYMVLGSPPMAPEKSAAGNHSVSPEQIKEMVQRLAERLQSNPQDGEGWLMLGRSYSVLGRYPEAAAAYGRAIGLLPPDANLLADYADILAMAQGRTLKGEPEKIIARALEVDPHHVKALALSGSVAFERQDFAKAIGEWRKILAAVPPDSPIAQSIGNSIRDAEAKLSGSAPSTMPPLAVAGQNNDKESSKESAGKNAEVGGTVSLAPALKDRVAASDTVFIFARALDGSRMPLAMVRKKVADLPIAFTLTDAMAMAPSARLSAHTKVKIGARVSKSGDAISAMGDLEGFSAEVELGRRDVAVTIDQIVK